LTLNFFSLVLAITSAKPRKPPSRVIPNPRFFQRVSLPAVCWAGNLLFL
jgi:hypothetical protein